MDTPPPAEPIRKPMEKRPEKKPSGFSYSALGYALVALAGVVLILYFLPHDLTFEIKYSDLFRLAEQGPGGSIEVEEGLPTNRKKVRYSKLFELAQKHNFVVGPEEITGTINREVLDPPPVKPNPEHPVEFSTSRLGLGDDVANFEAVLRKHGLPFSGRTPPSPLQSNIVLIVLGISMMLLIVFVFRKLVGNGSPISFGRSRGRMHAQEDHGVTFDDVAGVDEAVDELREVVEFLKTPEKYQVLGGRIPKGVLLVGPPGTGKTLLAKAVAGEAGVPFYSLSGSDFVEMFVGVGAARVRDMFSQAETKAPCIIFIDELDALGKARGGSAVGAHEEREQTLNALLVEMDGFNSNNGVIVMAATNRPETLDPALLRPGRFDRHVLVDRPDIRGREAILKVHAQHVKLAEDLDIRALAGISSGFVGADLANLVNEAALLAARKGKTSVGMEEFNEGVERVTAGLEKKQRIIHEDEKQRVAYHESGHALVAYSLPNTDPIHKVSIIPRGIAALGYVMQRPEGDRYLMTQRELESRVKVLLAGTMAEEIVFNETSTGAQNDLERASEIARSMVMEFGMSRLGRVNYRESGRNRFLPGIDMPRSREHSEETAREIDQEVHHIIADCLRQVKQIIETRRDALEALARTLIEKEVIDADELRRVIEENSPSVQIVPGTLHEPKVAGIIPPAANNDAERA